MVRKQNALTFLHRGRTERFHVETSITVEASITLLDRITIRQIYILASYIECGLTILSSGISVADAILNSLFALTNHVGIFVRIVLMPLFVTAVSHFIPLPIETVA